MAAKKKTITSAKSNSDVSTKKAAIKKTVLKPGTAKATKRKLVRSPNTPLTEEVADSNATGANNGRSVGKSKSGTDSRTQYEKLVNPQTYYEYMRASKFRGNR